MNKVLNKDKMSTIRKEQLKMGSAGEGKEHGKLWKTNLINFKKARYGFKYRM